ncbi:hypothetical protein D3C87_1014950 [compost metagenome]
MRVSMVQPGNLKFGRILVGPEPGDRAIVGRLAHDRKRHDFRHIDGVLHRFKPNPPSVEGKTCAVACGVYGWVARAACRIDNDAVVDGQAGPLRQTGFGNHPYPHHHGVRLDDRAVHEPRGLDPPVPDVQASEAGLLKDPNAMLSVQRAEVGRGLARRYSSQNSAIALDQRHVHSQPPGYGSGFQADIAATHDEQMSTLHHFATQAPGVGQGPECVDVGSLPALLGRQRPAAATRGKHQMVVRDRPPVR